MLYAVSQIRTCLQGGGGGLGCTVSTVSKAAGTLFAPLGVGARLAGSRHVFALFGFRAQQVTRVHQQLSCKRPPPQGALPVDPIMVAKTIPVCYASPPPRPHPTRVFNTYTGGVGSRAAGRAARGCGQGQMD